MKKLLLYILTCALLCAGCAAPETEKHDRLSVVCTVFPCYDLARAVLGSDADITMLIPPGSEPHNYDPTPSDMLKIQNCDVFIYVGGESEAWAEDILSSLGAEQKALRLMDCVTSLAEEHTDAMTVEEEEGEEDEWDEHIWTSPVNMQAMLRAVLETLCQADESRADAMQKNADAYMAELEGLDGDIRAAVAAGSRRKVVFADRFPFLYFVREYGLDYEAAFPGCSSATEPGVATVAALANAVKEEKIPVLFRLQLSSGRLAETLSEETGAKVLPFHDCHNVTADEFSSGETYVSLMRANLANLIEALQ